MRRRIVAGNWKMNTTYTEAMALVDALKESLTEEVVRETGVIITPPALYLSDIVESLVENPYIAVAAQNCHEKESGAYTGEWSAPMLASLDIDAIILGHSERREYFGETNEACNTKISQALNNELAAIYCIGETLEERKSGAYMDVILKQCEEGLAGFIGDDMDNIILAYEPVWAIGTGETASPEQAQEVHAGIRAWLTERFDAETAQDVSILYGGSCKPGNAAELFAKVDIDGGLIGGASLNAEDFTAIIEARTEA
ncbi:MAG: triose-phosphate isomerase [Schleiferiaceae bacterium]|nr:triose-phosphate isomerase [Schleiferiaceae bacterium]